MFILHCVHPSLCSSFIVFILHCVHPSLCSSFIVFILHCVHPSTPPYIQQSLIPTIHITTQSKVTGYQLTVTLLIPRYKSCAMTHTYTSSSLHHPPFSLSNTQHTVLRQSLVATEVMHITQHPNDMRYTKPLNHFTITTRCHISKVFVHYNVKGKIKARRTHDDGKAGSTKRRDSKAWD